MMLLMKFDQTLPTDFRDIYLWKCEQKMDNPGPCSPLKRQEKLEDLKVLRRSPDLLNNVEIGQGQLQLIMEQILFYHIWGLQTFWSSDLNNLMNNPSNSPVISEKQTFR